MNEDGIDAGGYDGGSTEPQGDVTTGGINPAWQEYLNSVPQEHQQYVIPAFKAWDSGVQQRFNQVHQRYEPWKPLIDNGVDAETATFAVNLLNELNENPQKVYQAIGDFYKDQLGTGSDSGQGQDGPITDDVNPLDPRISNLERQNQIMAQHLINQQKEAQLAQAQAELDSELNAARKKYGQYDEKFVLAYMQNGFSAEDAVKSYHEWVNSQRAQFGAKPLIMGTGGAAPQFNTDVRKLSDGDTRNLVVQMLQAHAAENKQ